MPLRPHAHHNATAFAFPAFPTTIPADGSFFCLIPTFVSEAFGVASFGATFGFQGLAPAVGSQVFSTSIAGNLADKHRRDAFVNVTASDGTSTLHCLGEECFRDALLINTGGCILAACCALLLAYRQRKLIGDTIIVLRRRRLAIKSS